LVVMKLAGPVVTVGGGMYSAAPMSVCAPSRRVVKSNANGPFGESSRPASTVG